MQIALTLAVTALLGMVQERENPAFKYWTEWKAGAWVKYKMDMDQGGQKMEMETVIKLLEASAEKITIETSGKMKIGGQEIATPAQKTDVKPKDDKSPKIDKEGDEEIEVAGKKLKAHWIEFSQEAAGKKMQMKAWLCKEVPGGLVKTVTTLEGGDAPMMKMAAVEWGDKAN